MKTLTGSYANTYANPLVQTLLCVALLALALGTGPAMAQPFTDIGAGLTGLQSGDAIWGDYDSDGDLDLLITGGNLNQNEAHSIIYRNDGNNTFTDIGAGLTGLDFSDADWGDYDNDGDLDLVISGQDNLNANKTLVYRNNGDDTFTDIGAGLAESRGSLGWGDYDGDGDLDLAFNTEGLLAFYRNDGTDGGGGWIFTLTDTFLLGGAFGSAEWGDYDNDGDPDLLITGQISAGNDLSVVYRNDGSDGGSGWVFTDIGAGLTGLQGGEGTWGDYDADGDLDLAITGSAGVSFTPTTLIYRNDGAGTFTDIGAGLTGLRSSSVDWGDYDADGDLDLLLAGDDGSTAHSRIYRNDGADTFTDLAAGLTGLTYGGAGWGDYDADGDVDLVVIGWDITDVHSLIYRNDRPPPNLAVTPADHDYGSVDLGVAVAQTFVATNTGAAGDINVTATALAGDAVADYTITSGGGAFTLAPGATHDIVVTFTPAEANFRGATLSMTSDDPDENQLDVALGGFGIAPPELIVTATDDLFEDKVEIRWSGVTGNDLFYRVERNGTLLAVAASNKALYTDLTGDPGVIYSYCVIVVENGVDTFTDCDDGGRKIFKPTDFTAPDGAAEQHVLLTWTDRSKIESGYTLARNPGNALTFDGTDDYVEVPDTDLTGGFTFAFWARRTGTNGDFIVGQGVASIDNQGLQIGFSANKMQLDFRGNMLETSQTYTDTDWHHWAVTYNATTLARAIYRDGVLVASDVSPAAYAGSGVLHLGQKAWGLAQYEGELDEMQLWSKALTAAEVKTAMDGLLAGTESGLTAYWPLDAASGTTARDAVGDLTGTLMNMAGTEWAESGVDELRAALPKNTVLYADATAEPGVVYEYVLAAFVDTDGDGRFASGVDFASVVSTEEGWRAFVTPPANVAATDGQYTDRVRITWGDQSADETGYTVYRAGVEIGTVDADVTVYDDVPPMAETVYTYCVTGTIDGTESVQVCDDGMMGGLVAPEDVIASVDTFDDRVQVRWQDVADSEDGFEILRDGVALGTVGVEVETYNDFTAEQAVDYTYCVRAFSDADPDNLSYSDQLCDAGRRSNVLAPTDVLASDADFEDQVAITWQNPSTTVMLFNIYRVDPETADSILIKTISQDLLSFADLEVASDVTYDYCVAAMTVPGATGNVQTQIEQVLAEAMMQEAVLQATEASFQIGGQAEQARVLFARVEEVVQAGMTTARLSMGTSSTIVESARVCNTGARSITPPSGVAASYEEFEDHVQVTWTNNAEVATGFNVYRTVAALGSSALSFDGVDGFVDVPADPTLEIENQLTLEAWINPTTFVNFAGIIDNIYDTSFDESGYGLLTRSDNTVEFVLRTSDTGFGYDACKSPPLEPGVWYHVAGTYDGTNRRLYVDGQLQAICAVTGTIDYVPGNDLKIGSYIDNDESHRFDGRIDEVRIWDVARTAAELTANKDRALTGTEPGLVAYWPLEEGTGTVASDLAGGLDGTLAGGVVWSAITLKLLDQIGATRTSYSDYTGVPGTAYTYGVAALDAYGESQHGSDLGRRSLKAPVALQATDGTSETQVVLTWIDESRAEDGYVILRDGTPVDSTAANATTYTDTAGIVFGMVHAYSIRAFDAYGTSGVAEDDGFTILLPPTNVNASDTYPGGVVVVWEDVSGLETGYEVRRGGVAIHTTAANVTTYTDLTAVAGQTYSYCVVTKGSGSGTSTEVCDAGGIPAVLVETDFTPELLFTASSAAVSDEFGYGVAVDGDWAIIGARLTDDQNRGGIYFYERNGARWEFRDFFTAPAQVDAQQGFSVDISGNYAILGAPCDIGANGLESGAAYIYERVGNTWSQIAKIIPPDGNPVQLDRFGHAVSIDGDWVIVGSPTWDDDSGNVNEGRIHFYKRESDGTWTHKQAGNWRAASNAEARYGTSVSLNGDWAAVGAPDADVGLNDTGAIDILKREGDVWVGKALYQGVQDGHMGTSVGMGEGWAVAGSPGRSGGLGGINVFKRNTDDTWAFFYDRSGVEAGEGLGRSIAIAGNNIVAGTGQNRIRSYTYDNGWTDADPATYVGTGNFARESSALGLGNNWMIAGAPLAFNESDIQTGAVYMSSILRAPEDALASDGLFEDRIQITWTDLSEQESGYHVYRREADGKFDLVGTTAPEAELFDDFSASAGGSYEYCVRAFQGTKESGLTDKTCELGWRPPNGTISGRVAALGGGGTEDVQLCLAPSPNRGLLFDGVGGAVVIENDGTGSLDVGNTLTIEAWIKPARLDGRFGVFTTRIDNISGAYQLEVGTGNGGQGRLAVTGLGTWVAETPDAALDVGQWTHVAYTRSGTGSGTHALYINGQLQTLITDANYTFVDHAGDRGIGVGASLGDSFDGQIDDVRVWNIARSEADLQADMHRQLTGEEEGLVGYWLLDEGARRVTADQTGSGNNGLLVDGVHWTDMGAFDICATSDLEGNYNFAGLRYGESVEFLLTPNSVNRSFEPAFKTITLSTESPVQNEVLFSDATSFTVAGIVQFQGTECPVPDVEIWVDDGLKTKTESDGTYTLSVDPSDEATDLRRIEARFTNTNDAADIHTFSPDEYPLFVEEDQFGIDFTNQKVRTLSGTFTGSCDTDIGTATIRIFTEDGCFVREIAASGFFEERLPPQKYLIQVVNVSTESDLRTDIIQFFDGLGAQQVDLTLAVDTVDFIYRAPVAVAIEGFSAPPQQCTVYTAEDGTTIPSVPIVAPLFVEADVVDLTIRAFEDYGDPNDPNDDGTTHCPVDEGTITIFDGIADLGDTPIVLDIENGQVAHQTFGATPDLISGRVIDGVNRSFQKPLVALAEVTGRPVVTETAWVVVEGVKARQSTFVSATTGMLPLLALHDPPGSESYSYLEQGATYCRSFKDLTLSSGGFGIESDVVFGGKVSFSVGFGLILETSEIGAGFALRGRTVGGGGSEITHSGFEVCATTTERFTTLGDLTWVGEDLFMGMALNLEFAKADLLEVDTQACTLEQSETLVGDFNQLKPFETTYVYGETHIEKSLIPALEGLIALEDVSETDVIEGDIGDERRSETLREAVDGWENILADNQQNIADGLLADKKNRSFSGGTDYEFTEVYDSTWVLKERADFTYLDFEIGAGLVITAFYDQTFLLVGEAHGEWRTEVSEDSTSTITMGYVLSDGDTGDFFSVDVGTDPVYGTPVFGIVSGRSSNPWEPGTQQRDKPRVEIDPPALHNVPDGEQAVFTLSLINESESQEQREYRLRSVQTANPFGAVLQVNGNELDNEIPFVIPADEAVNVTMVVDRGPNAYTYDDLEIFFMPLTEFEIWQTDPRVPFVLSDTARFSISWQAPCSEIGILRPRSPWVLNAATAPDLLEIILHEFTLTPSEEDPVEKIGLEYRLAGDIFPGGDDDGWRFLEEVLATALGDGTTSWTTSWLPPQDGDYELRAFTSCPLGGKVFSEVVTGTHDTAAPERFGTPQPADQILNLGDDIAITYNEPIDCGSVATAGQFVNAELAYVDGPDAGLVIEGTTATCRDNQLILEPPVTFDWAAAENLTLEARLLTNVLDGDLNPVVITDLAGNPISSAVSWSFVVQRSSFTWVPLALDATVNRYTLGTLTADLVNGQSAAMAFTLEDVPTWLTPSHTDGTVAPGEALAVTFTVADTLAEGVYPATVIASTGQGPAALTLMVTVVDLQQQQIALGAGWSWFSLNRTPSNAHPDSVLQAVSAAGGDLLKSQSAFSLYDHGSGAWVGSLGVLSPGTMYQTKLAEAATMVVGGPAVDPATLPITVNQGWNWIGYLPQMPVEINAALTSLGDNGMITPGDLIKSQTAFAAYDGSEWVGTLTQLDPGQGYMLNFQDAAGSTLVYPSNEAALAAVGALAVRAPSAAGPTHAGGLNPSAAPPASRPIDKTVIKTERRGAEQAAVAAAGTTAPVVTALPELSVAPGTYAHSMTLIGQVTLDGVPLADADARVWITDGDKMVRGAARLQYLEASGEHRAFLMLYSDLPKGESFNVHVHDPATDEVITLAYRLNFQSDYRAGSVAEPVEIAAETEAYRAAKAAAELPEVFSLSQNYPNPFNPVTTIHYELPEAAEVRLIVFDVLGREVLRLIDGEQKAGRYDVAFDGSRLASGVYLYRLEAGAFSEVHKMVLMK